MKGNSNLATIAVSALSQVAEPLANGEFATLLEPWLPVGLTKLGLAISGGPDSMALAACTARWAKDKGIMLQGFIVDHQLRSESGREAELVQQRCSAVGIKADILRWEHPLLASRLHVAARDARYGLLTAACRNHGIDHLLLAHQQEDQAETILMRLCKGSGIKGLGGMRPLTQRDGVTLVRPFLTLPKARLTATCQALNVTYVIDPSNRSPRFARGRLRGVLPLLAEEGLTQERLTDLGQRAAEAQQALDHYTSLLWHSAVTLHPTGWLTINRREILAAPSAITLAVLAQALRLINPTALYDPERQSLLRLHRLMTASTTTKTHSLHGCLLACSPTTIKVLREPAAICERLSIASGQSLVWDGRWQIQLAQEFAEAHNEVRALGSQPAKVLDDLAPGLRHFIPSGRVRASLPALWRGTKLLLIPALPSSPWKSPLSAKIIMPDRAV